MTSPADSPHRHYTASEIEAANDTDLPALLSSLGYHVKRVGRFYTTLEMDSLRIKDRRIWYRYSESIGGDAVAFLRRFHGMSFPEAVHYLLDFSGYSGDSILPRQRNRPSPQRGRPVFVLPPPHSDNERVCAYLRGRGIAPSIIGSFIKMGLLYEDKDHILQEIFARLTMYNFSELISTSVVIERSGNKYVYRANFSAAAHICRNFFLGRVAPADLDALIARFVSPIRPGRASPRHLTVKYPVSFFYRLP